ncbi:hypothetical protein QR98_0043440 [Sarcoptes scabiei]|uniref:Uncharacterized protein n=1 Tax=Sarcoptes scabiei TaxID=52283 RepID=A0A132A4G3_SARSC|nr:hypothetical protein QR98_0043440 [Sarcoptes scabiei]
MSSNQIMRTLRIVFLMICSLIFLQSILSSLSFVSATGYGLGYRRIFYPYWGYGYPYWGGYGIGYGYGYPFYGGGFYG